MKTLLHPAVRPVLTVLFACVLVHSAHAQFTGVISSATNPIPGAKSKYARLDAARVHYLDFGRGSKALVLIHGWSGNGGFWREQVPALSGKARLILVDLPGHGQSDKPETDYTMDYLARGVLAVMRDASIDRATLIGHSMGVPVICRVHAQAPEKVAGLVAVDGLLRKPEIKPEDAEKFYGPYSQPDYREHVTRFIHSMFPKPGDQALRDRVLAEVMATPRHVMGSAMRAMFDASQPSWDLKNLKVPLLVINAPNPRWTPEYETYARGLGSQVDYRTMPEVGHLLMLEKPAGFNALLTEMLRKAKLIDD